MPMALKKHPRTGPPDRETSRCTRPEAADCPDGEVDGPPGGCCGFARLSLDALYRLDPETDSISWLNDRCRSILGIGSEVDTVEQAAARLMAHVHPDDREAVRAARQRALSDAGRVEEAEYRFLHPDGTQRRVRERWMARRVGGARLVEGMIRDETPDEVAEGDFIQSTANALIGNYLVQDGAFLYVNPEFVRITGYSRDELIGMDSLAIVRPDDRPHVRKNAVAMLKGETSTPYEFCAYDKSGKAHWAMETVTPVRHNGRRAVLGFFMDITQFREAQGNLSTLGLMISTVSHSLKGCLTGLDAGLYMVDTGFYRDLPARIEEGLDVAKLMVDRIRKLSMDILYYAKEREPDLSTVDIRRFAKEVILTVETRIRAADIRFDTRLPDAPGTFSVDEEILRAAFVNILENAMEACIADDRPIEHVISFTVAAEETGVAFRFSDNGPGMAPEQLRKIFQLFFSSKGKAGTGIGLFVTRKVIHQHGGAITAESTPGVGTTFQVTLPRGARPPDSRGTPKAGAF